MTNQTLKFLVITFLIVGLPLPGWAGALDRGPAQQRYNQAADEMIRVPGVVGMWESDAMAVLQQSGVVPNIEYSRKYREDLAGREGTVINQEPGAAGITMLGSTVTITVYWPHSEGEPPPGNGSGGQHENDGVGQQGGSVGANPPPVQAAPPQWGGTNQPAGVSQPDSGSGWTPPPVPAVEPYAEPQDPMPATSVNMSPNPIVMSPPTKGTPGR